MQNHFIQHTTGPAIIYQCIVTTVRPEKMSIDVYVPETSKNFRGVHLLSPNISTAYGNTALPEIDSLGLVAVYHKTHYPVFLGCIPGYGFNSGEQTFEPLCEGEQQITAIGGGFLKLDQAGNCVQGSNSSAHQWLMHDGTFAETGREFLEFSNLHRNSLRIESNNDIISLNRVFEYHQCFQAAKYSESDILKENTVDWDLEEKILHNAYQAMQRLSGDNDIFAKTEAIVSALITKHTCTESDITDYEASLESLKLKTGGCTVRGEIFGNSAVKLEVLDKDEALVAGIEIDGNFGGKLIGRWE